MRLSVIGLGKLGSPMVAALASRGHEVIGLDIMPASVAAMNGHKAPVTETGLQKLIDENKKRISATTDWDQAILGSDASFIIVPTPSGSDGAFTNKFVVDACTNIGNVLKNKKDFHLIVVISTMMPGSSEKEIIPVLERASGKKAGVDFGYCYSPTLVALGAVIKGFLNPELVMVGASDARSGDMLESLYKTVFLSKPVFHHVSPKEAELAKIGINTFITTKISFANMLGMISEAMGINPDNVTKILGSDSRIGPKVLKAGGSYGGPCFPRDNRAFTRAAELVGVTTYIPRATDETNKRYIAQLAERVQEAVKAVPSAKVGIVGVAYKPDTDVVEEGMGLLLASQLVSKGVSVVVYDPAATPNAKKALGDTVLYSNSLEGHLAASQVIVITNPYREQFANIDPSLLRGKYIIDCWNILPKKNG
jgi:UDPglucose 6-dehydrogenase